MQKYIIFFRGICYILSSISDSLRFQQMHFFSLKKQAQYIWCNFSLDIIYIYIYIYIHTEIAILQSNET
jgi:hypothetical protein